MTASGALVTQDGETVTFTPDREPVVAAGGVVTFSGEVTGLLAMLTSGCAIGGGPLLGAGAAATVRFRVARPKVGAEPPKEYR